MNLHHGQNHHSTGDFVQPMNDEYFSILFFKHLYKIWRILLPSIWKDGQSCGLIDNDNMVVFIENIHKMDLTTNPHTCVYRLDPLPSAYPFCEAIRYNP